MKTAQYHQEAREPQTFDVLAEHEDGTLDLGRGEVLVIGKCPIAAESKPGFATLIAEEKSEEEKQADADAKKAAADQKAADAAAKKQAEADAKKAAADKKAADKAATAAAKK